MDNVIIEKNGRRYRVEQFDTDGVKRIAQDGIPVEYQYKAGQFVVTTDGPQPANHYHVLVFDDLKAMEPYTTVEGALTPQEDANSLGGHPHDDNAADTETVIVPDESFAKADAEQHSHDTMTGEGAPAPVETK